MIRVHIGSSDKNIIVMILKLVAEKEGVLCTHFSHVEELPLCRESNGCNEIVEISSMFPNSINNYETKIVIGADTFNVSTL